MSSTNPPRRVQPPRGAQPRPFGIGEYEHIELLTADKEVANEKPFLLAPWEQQRQYRINGLGYVKGGSSPDDDEGASKIGKTGRIWRTRRRRDGKIFLATEYVDYHRIMNDAKETLLRLLNHPNLICLIDVVQDTNVGLKSNDYTVWEDCTGGTLNRLLYRENKQDTPVYIPESLCWHVLDGISQALLWLHHGYKHTFPFNHHMEHDDDWHPILISDITPANIYFAAREGEETYGDVKLGNFRSAAVNPSKVWIKALRPPWIPQHGPYTAPEIRRNLQSLSDASEVWSLGAILYHMMGGSPPLPLNVAGVAKPPSEADFYVRKLPQRFSPRLREIVMGMLRVDSKARPTVLDLSEVVDAGWAAWREDTEEGKKVILKGHQEPNFEAEKSRIEAQFPRLVKAGNLDNI